jgi:zinc/manganese transport system permease protein
MSEAIHWFLLQIALIAVVLLLHTYIGLHIIRRTLIFSDLVLDQLAAFGAIVGVGLGISYASPASYGCALVAVLIGSFLLAVIKPKRSAIPREAVIGILYAMALVLSLLWTDKLEQGQDLVEKALSGFLPWVTWPLVRVTIVVYLLLMVIHYLLRHKFIALAEKPGSLRNERWWDFLFFTTQGVITVLIVPVAGVLLAYSFLMIPAAIATLFTRKWSHALVLGWTVGFVACMVGLVTSYVGDFTYGPSLVLSLGLFFVIALILRRCISPKTLSTPVPEVPHG